MRLPRFRVRTLMFAVGVVTLLTWGAMMGTRSYVYYRLARTYGTYERQWRELALRHGEDPVGRTRSIAVKWGPQIADFHASMARKYRQAMWHPWIAVAPDPPAPVFGP